MSVPGWVGAYVGENVAAGTAGITSLADATNAAKVQASLASGVTSWWSEKSSYDYAANTCQSGKQCGHSTQLAWASNKSVGCALVMCAPHKTFNAAGDSMVCELGPGGNTNGKRPY
jgi:hypothetical protein